MKIGVVILNYNSSSDCMKCISSLSMQQEVELDLIVVDNCSIQEERSKLENFLKGKKVVTAHQITYIPNNDNKGYNAGNNIGLRYAAQKGYEYALISNPDMEYPDTLYVKKLIVNIKSDSRVVVWASDIINNEGLHQNPMRELSFWEEFLWPIEWLKNKNKSVWYVLDYSTSCICEKVSGCCLLVDLSFMKEINFFDENVFLYSEESILGKQVSENGRKMQYDSNVYAIHRHIESAKGNKTKRMLMLFQSRGYYLERYSGYNKFKLLMLTLSRSLHKILWNNF